MATLNAVAVGESVTMVTPISVQSGGDQIAPNGASSLVLHFRNTAASGRTITVVSQQASITEPGTGVVLKPNREITITQNQEASIHLENLGPYLNTNGRVQLNYNASSAVTVRPIGIS